MSEQPFPIEACRSCDHPIIWTVTTGGKAKPVEPQIAADGNVALSWRAGHVLAEVLPVAKRFGRVNLRKSHFATCKQASMWRRSGRSAS